MGRSVVVLACVAMLLGGCGGGPTTERVAWRSVPAVSEPPPLGFSVEGRPILCSVYGRGAETVLIVGGIHGSEPAGAVLPKRLCTYLDAHPGAFAGKRVVVAAETNPDGLARGQRTNARGVDLNRNFATANWRSLARHGPEPFSEPEARFVASLIRRYRPARIVTVHQPLTCVDYDGPARDLAQAIASASRLPVRKLGAKPGSLGSYAGIERQIPIVTLELPEAATQLGPDTLWERYGDALLAAIQFPSAQARTTRYPAIEVGGEMRLRWEHRSR